MVIKKQILKENQISEIYDMLFQLIKKDLNNGIKVELIVEEKEDFTKDEIKEIKNREKEGKFILYDEFLKRLELDNDV